MSQKSDIEIAQACEMKPIIKILRFNPFDVGQINPVKVWIRFGTPAIQAAVIHSSPALGVIECTISGFSFRKT